jgi:glycosyltransferase involved in cell wall biosynthesis
VILGDGPMASELQGTIDRNRMHRVRLLGQQPRNEVLRWIARAWALTVPSEWYENLPYVAVESLSLGTPVLASRIGGLAEMVSHGANGWTFSCGDTRDLHGAMLRVLSDGPPTKEFSERCRSFYQDRYSGPVVYRSLMSVYEPLVNRTRASSDRRPIP